MFVHISAQTMLKTLNCQTEFDSVQWLIEYTGPTVHCDPNNFRKD